MRIRLHAGSRSERPPFTQVLTYSWTLGLREYVPSRKSGQSVRGRDARVYAGAGVFFKAWGGGFGEKAVS